MKLLRSRRNLFRSVGIGLTVTAVLGALLLVKHASNRNEGKNEKLAQSSDPPPFELFEHTSNEVSLAVVTWNDRYWVNLSNGSPTEVYYRVSFGSDRPDYSLQKRTDDRWVPAVSSWNCVPSDATVPLPPGSSKTFDLLLIPSSLSKLKIPFSIRLSVSRTPIKTYASIDGTEPVATFEMNSWILRREIPRFNK
ncbi:MAG: hypothetical protein HY043_02275 [Verrucomicrobia bacterium]|nr:hypothetical protein [Verrucomicrobiota bacterium]